MFNITKTVPVEEGPLRLRLHVSSFVWFSVDMPEGGLSAGRNI